MTVPVINIQKTVDESLNIYEVLIKIHCVLENIYIKYSEARLLAYYMKYDITKKAEELFFEDGRFNYKQSVTNYRRALISKGLINEYINEDKNKIFRICDKLNNRRIVNDALAIKLNVVTNDFLKRNKSNTP